MEYVSCLAQAARKIAFLGLGLGGLALPSVVGSLAQQPGSPRPAATAQPRALDTLQVNERTATERVARADPKVKELVGEAGVRLVSVTPVLLKGESPEKFNVAQRQVEVILFHPGREVGARVIVDLQQNRVVSVTKLSSDQVLMTNDDLEDAWQLALKDAEVVRALGPAAQTFHVSGALSATGTAAAATENVVEGLPVRSEEGSDPCSKHRCLQLLFRRGNDYLMNPVVTVDLTAKHVTVEHAKTERKADH